MDTNIGIDRNEFKFLFQDLVSRGLLRVSQDLDDYEDIYQVNSLVDEATNDNLPRIKITEMGSNILDYIAPNG